VPLQKQRINRGSHADTEARLISLGLIGPAEEAAEKAISAGQEFKNHPSGAKAQLILSHLRHD
jgi:hypothetical protein